MLIHRWLRPTLHHARLPCPFQPSPWRIWRHSRRNYSSILAARCEEVDIECRSSGSLKLNIYHPLTGVSIPRILIYLPSGPLWSEPYETRDDEVVSALSASANATVVKINYRLGDDFQYPVPVHDVLTGYDWILENLLPSSDFTPGKGRMQHRLGVCGELVGGGLAAMLAVTECRMGTNRVIAAALNTPILDWCFSTELPYTDLATLLELGDDLFGSPAPTKDPKGKAEPSWKRFANCRVLPSSTLLKARRHFFRKPDHYLDRYASATHFFRSPSILVQTVADNDESTKPSSESGDHSSSATQLKYSDPEPTEHDLYDLAMQAPFHDPSDTDFALLSGLEDASSPRVPRFVNKTREELVESRKYYRAYPPVNSGLSLPLFRLSVGEQNVLHDQGEEFIRLVRRSLAKTSLARHGKSKVLDNWGDEDVDLDELARKVAIEEAEKQAVLVTTPGVGLWSIGEDGGRWEKEVARVGAWFRQTLS